MSRIREAMYEFTDLFWMLWWHGTFPLRWVIYSNVGALLVGCLIGRLA